MSFKKNIQYYKFCLYGFFKNLRFFEPFIILFFLEKEITFLEIGILYSIREVIINILEIPSGLLSDIIGRKKTLIMSFIFYIFSFLIFYLSKTFPYFIIAIVLYGFGDALRTGNHKAMIFEYLNINGWNNQRAHYYGHTRSWSQFGSAISSLVAAGIVFYQGNYNSIFLISIFPYLIDLILVSSYPNKLDKSKATQLSKNLKDEIKLVFSDFLISFKNIHLLKSVLNLTIHSGFHRSIKDYLQAIMQTFAISLPFFIYMSEYKKTSIIIGLIYFIIYILTSVVTRKAGKLKDFFKSSEKALNITLYSGLILGFISGLLYNKDYYLISIVFYILIFLVENVRNPIGVSFVSEQYNDKILATALSLSSQLKSLIAAIIAPAIGYLADIWGVGVSLSIVAGLLIIISPFIILKQKLT